MANKTTSRRVLVWATAAGLLTGASDAAQAQARRLGLWPPGHGAMMQQARHNPPAPRLLPRVHSTYAGTAGSSHPATRSAPGNTAQATGNMAQASGNGIQASGNAAEAPIERRSAPQPGNSLGGSAAAGGQARPEPLRPPAPVERKDIPMMSSNNRSARGGEHLSEWMNQHGTLTPTQQQQALEKEPGFRELPQKTQQRLRDQLTQLNNMPPQQRARWVARTEAMERLTPDQRSQVRGAMQQLSALPPEQRGPVQRSFRQLRDISPDQRSAALDSGRYTGQLNPAQRATLTNLMRIEPMLEPPEPKQPAPPR